MLRRHFDQEIIVGENYLWLQGGILISVAVDWCNRALMHHLIVERNCSNDLAQNRTGYIRP
jgi:hypothetical protein